MNETRSWSATLVSVADANGKRRVACRACGHALCGTDEAWKDSAVLEATPLREAGGSTFRSAGEDVLLRRFYCPSCGTALDTEVALPGEPFLIDRVWG